MKIEIGQMAPDFTLYDTEKNAVSIHGQKGKNVLILFFPLAFTGVCTKELCSVRDSISLYNDSGAVVFGISVDSPQTLARFKAEQNLNFSLLSDFNKEVATLYGCIYENFIGWMKGVAKRSAFIIDKSGTIRYAEVLENAGEIPDFEKINFVLDDLKQI